MGGLVQRLSAQSERTVEQMEKDRNQCSVGRESDTGGNPSSNRDP